MANVTAKLRVIADASQVPGSIPGSATALSVEQTLTCTFGTSGTSADQVDLWSTFTLNLAAAPQTIDLTSLIGVYGDGVNMKRVKRITVKVLSTTDGDTLTISPGASNGWESLLGSGSTLILRAATDLNDSGLTLVCPSATGWETDSSHRTLTFDPSASTFDVELEFLGCSA